MNRQPSTPVCLAKVSDQVHHHAYGHGVIVAIAKGLPVIRFYDHDGFHGRRPLIVSSPYRVVPPVVVTLRKVTDSDPTPDSESHTPRDMCAHLVDNQPEELALVIHNRIRRVAH